MEKTNLYLHTVEELKTIVRSCSIENPTGWRKGVLVAWLLKHFPNKYKNEVVVAPPEPSEKGEISFLSMSKYVRDYNRKRTINEMEEIYGEIALPLYSQESKNNAELMEAILEERPLKRRRDKYYDDDDYDADDSESSEDESDSESSEDENDKSKKQLSN
jgi:hypothetical protein